MPTKKELEARIEELLAENRLFKKYSNTVVSQRTSIQQCPKCRSPYDRFLRWYHN